MLKKILISFFFALLTAALTAAEVPRIAHGLMDVPSFLAFLNASSTPSLQALSPLSLLALAFLGGLALNLTPCVLPLIPINLALIGASPRRAFFYALGMTLTYGALGLAAAFGSLAFGTIQGHPLFNFALALLFFILAFACNGRFIIDFSKYRKVIGGPFGAFLMGALSAILAGACVAPVLIGTLLLTASLFSSGHIWALALPFTLALGMAIPLPLLAAGLHILPRPGAWMKIVNRIFAALFIILAIYHATLAIKTFLPKQNYNLPSNHAISITPDLFEQTAAKLPRPILVICWASWCKNCAAMESTTLQNPRVQEELKKFSVIKLQAEKMTELKMLKGFENVMGLPAYLIFE